MAEMDDSERIIWEQAQMIEKLKQACRTLGATLEAEICTMQAASIAERLKPGSGMCWIDESLTEAWTYPEPDNEDAYWDGKMSAVEWFNARRDDERKYQAKSA